MGLSTASPSRTPPVDPGRLTTSVCPAKPLTPRDNMADGIPARTPAARMASAIPGTSRSTTRRVASGVPSFAVRPVPPAVSYTHLRAHETDSYLVCRLLLEKKKTHNP